MVEQDGELIITLEGEENPKFPLITDGQLQTDILEVIGKDDEWLMKEMKKKPVSRNSRGPSTPCPLMGVHLCTPLTANLNSGHVRSRPWSQ